MEIALSLPQDRFVVTEAVPLRVTLTNPGTSPIEVPDPLHEANWQPRYTLEGPGDRAQRSFTARQAVTGDATAAPAGADPVLQTLAGGASSETTVPLHRWLDLTEPGRYTISATLDWNGLSARSAPVRFTIDRPVVRSAALAADLDVPWKRQIQAAWIHEGAAGRRIYSAAFGEERPDLAEVSPPASTFLHDAGSGAVDVLAAWTNYDRHTSFHHWIAWREGGRLFARSLLHASAASVDAGGEPARVLRPAVASADGDLDVAFLAAGGREVAVARFGPPAGDSPPAPGRILWRKPLPWAASGVRFAVAPPALGSARFAAAVAQDGDALAVAILRAERDGAPADPSVLRFPGARALPDSEPALRIDAEGAVHFAVLCERAAAEPGGEHELVVAEAVVGPDGRGEPSLSDAARTDVLPRAATVRFGSTGSPPRRAWIALLPDGSVIHSVGDGVPRTLTAPVTLPLELLPRSQAVYVLTADPAAGVRLEALR